MHAQAYVALSRATTLDGLMLVDFDASRVKAHQKVKAFYSGLEVRANLVSFALRAVLFYYLSMGHLE